MEMPNWVRFSDLIAYLFFLFLIFITLNYNINTIIFIKKFLTKSFKTFPIWYWFQRETNMYQTSKIKKYSNYYL